MGQVVVGNIGDVQRAGEIVRELGRGGQQRL